MVLVPLVFSSLSDEKYRLSNRGFRHRLAMASIVNELIVVLVTRERERERERVKVGQSEGGKTDSIAYSTRTGLQAQALADKISNIESFS